MMAQLSLLRKCLPFTLSLLATVTAMQAIPTVAQPNPTTLDHSAQTNSQPLHQPEMQLMQAQVPGLPMWVYPVGTAVLILLFLPKIGWIAGLIVIGEREVGIVTKKFSSKSLPAGRLIALNGVASSGEILASIYAPSINYFRASNHEPRFTRKCIN